MADVNRIKLPNGSTYNLKDDSAVANITRSGTTFTATKRDGTTFTFTQQDNNTTYTVATGDSNGQIKVTPSGGTAYNVSVKGLGTAAYKGDTDFVINYKSASRSTATTGSWVSMMNSSSTGSPTLPTSGKWWQVLSLDCWGSAPKNWVSQLALATQDGGGVWWRRNDASGTSIDSSTWHRLAEGDSNGNAVNANKVNNLTVQTAVPANAKFTDTTYESKAAASGGTAVSLCTTGEKYTWNNKSNLTLGTTSTTALKGDTKYAGSSSAGGSATSAVKLDTATAGSATQPCYFTSGKPSACTYSLNKTVPADAVFTDTTVIQSLSSSNENYPILMSYADSSNTDTDVTKICYRNNSVYINPSTGNIQATQLNGVTIGSSPKFTDTNNAVTQTATSTNANYEVLFSSTADNTTRTEGARKNSNLTFNPSTGFLTATSLRVNGSSGTNGVIVNNGIILKNSTFTNDIARFRADYNSGGGCLKLNNSDGSGESVYIYSDSNNSGSIWLSDSDASTADKSRVQIGSSNGGAIYLKDNDANATIGLTGFNGNINCKTINSHLVPKITFANESFNFTSSTTLTYIGKSITCAIGHRMLVRLYFRYVNSGPVETAASKNSTTVGGYYSECLGYGINGACGCLTFMLVGGETVYLFAKYASAAANRVDITTIDYVND